ncbi:hypothetical protein D3C73_1344310 [compost metagenome]
MLQQNDLPPQRGCIDGGSKSSQVMMLAHPVKLEITPVQEKTLLAVQLHRAETEAFALFLNGLPVREQLRLQRVQPRSFNIPEQRLLHGQPAVGMGGPAAPLLRHCCFLQGNRIPPGIQNSMAEL